MHLKWQESVSWLGSVNDMFDQNTGNCCTAEMFASENTAGKSNYSVNIKTYIKLLSN